MACAYGCTVEPCPGPCGADLPDELDEKLRDGLKALQAREEALIAELGEQAMPEREKLFGIGGPFERFGIEVAE